MNSKELLKKVRQIEIKSRRLSDNLFGGEYLSTFKGRGMTFSEVRKYEFGDDIRSIDWNVTARYNEPFIKVFEEERELTLMLLIDVSGSENFATSNKLKKEIITEIAATLAFSALKNNDKVGLILFSDTIEKYIVPKKGKTHVLRVIRELLYKDPIGSKTSISKALDYLLKVAKRKCVVFLISDFLDDNFLTSLKVVNKKHDFLAIQVLDPAELEFPELGFLKVEDPETGEMLWIDTSSKKTMEQLKKDISTKQLNFKKKMRNSGIDLVSISTDKDFVDPLLSFFKSREKRN